VQIAEYRQQIIDELVSLGVDVVDWSDDRFDPPIAYLHPAEEFISKPFPTAVGKNDCQVTVNYILRLFTGKGDADNSAREIDDLIAKCVLAFRHLDDVSVSNLDIAVDNGGGQYMTATVYFSNTINLEEG
jgi:hypothetical protein